MSELSEFILGQKACVNGELCPQGASKDFQRGYAYQYELEQVLEHNPKAAKQ